MTNTLTAPKVDTPHTERHAPELYAPVAIAEGVHGFAGVDEAALVRYREQGYLVIHEAFTADEVEGAKAGLADLIMGHVPGFDCIEFEAGAAAILGTLGLDERQDAVRKLMFFTAHEPRLHALAAHPMLLSVLARTLGDAPVLFQDMALLKPPHIGREKPWHQDHAYFDYPLGTPIVGTWTALDEATVENGCMHLLAGAHRDGPIPHFQRRDWQICDTQMLGQTCVAAPLGPGGMLLFDALLPHGTPLNQSGARRRAVQYHYAPQSARKSVPEERLAVFGSEGKNVSC